MRPREGRPTRTQKKCLGKLTKATVSEHGCIYYRACPQTQVAPRADATEDYTCGTPFITVMTSRSLVALLFARAVAAGPSKTGASNWDEAAKA